MLHPVMNISCSQISVIFTKIYGLYTFKIHNSGYVHFLLLTVFDVITTTQLLIIDISYNRSSAESQFKMLY